MRGNRGHRAAAIFLALVLAPIAGAQQEDRTEMGPKTVIGPRNPDLHEGAQQLKRGNGKVGVELTLRGLEVAQGAREEEAALSNLCAGYIMLKQYDEALRYCNLLLARNDRSWRGYNNRALIYIHAKEYDKANADLEKGEELNPGARTLQVARSIYLDAVEPVTPEVEIDDRQPDTNEDDEAN
ncbi:MAG TPA: tetratricopeptide repeat protein [Woeseiaceae bacterium]|jgi:tetratricopeptide (TPR) repeat protein|nr:tetratricopeptide repeat protein [Woeseiaceae bacterium]